MPSNTAGALSYARKGKPVFPCDQNKQPLVPKGFHAATANVAQVQAWWSRWPNALIGMPTGAASGLIVIDLDVREGYDGTDAWHNLVASAPEPVAETVVALTPSGGQHLYFRWPGQSVRNSASKLGLGIDVRGDGGYVIVPPSVLEDGRRYEWEASNPDKPAALSAYILRLLGQTPAPKSVSDGPQEAAASEGQRNVHLASYAGRLAYAGLSREQIRASVLAENERACRPPLSAAELDRTIFKSAGVWVAKELESPTPKPPPISGPAPEKPEDVPEAELWPAHMDFSALIGKEPPEPGFIINDWLPCGYATLLAGHGGVGKSQIALYLAVCIALGLEFFGMQCERRRVLYLSCEDREPVLHWRLYRICEHLGVDFGELIQSLDVIDLVASDSILWASDCISTQMDKPAMTQFRMRVDSYGTDVVFIDGVSDTFAGNENDRSHVKAYISTLLSAIDPDDGALVLLGHIPKPNGLKQEGYSGSTGWHNGVRARWYLYPEKAAESDDLDASEQATGDLLMELQKSNLGKADQSMRFSWNREARLFTGKRVVPMGGAEARQREKREQDAIVEAFKAVEAAGDYVPAARQGPSTAWHRLSARAEFPDSLRAENPANRRRFRKHLEMLRANGVIEEVPNVRKNRNKVDVLRLKPTDF